MKLALLDYRGEVLASEEGDAFRDMVANNIANALKDPAFDPQLQADVTLRLQVIASELQKIQNPPTPIKDARFPWMSIPLSLMLGLTVATLIRDFLLHRHISTILLLIATLFGAVAMVLLLRQRREEVKLNDTEAKLTDEAARLVGLEVARQQQAREALADAPARDVFGVVNRAFAAAEDSLRAQTLSIR